MHHLLSGSTKVMVIGLLIVISSCRQPQSEATPSVVLPAVSEIPYFSLPLSVTQAYQAIPHQRTEFNPTFSSVPEPDKTYLALMFSLIDQAIAVRVSTLRAYTSGDRTSDGIDQYQALIEFTDSISPPAHLASYHQDIKLSLQAQQAFFQDWRAKSRGFGFTGNATGNHPQVQTASSHLRSAYNQLMSAYPQEDSINQAAFFDYHCALDFI